MSIPRNILIHKNYINLFMFFFIINLNIYNINLFYIYKNIKKTIIINFFFNYK